MFKEVKYNKKVTKIYTKEPRKCNKCCAYNQIFYITKTESKISGHLTIEMVCSSCYTVARNGQRLSFDQYKEARKKGIKFTGSYWQDRDDLYSTRTRSISDVMDNLYDIGQEQTCACGEKIIHTIHDKCPKCLKAKVGNLRLPRSERATILNRPHEGISKKCNVCGEETTWEISGNSVCTKHIFQKTKCELCGKEGYGFKKICNECFEKVTVCTVCGKIKMNEKTIESKCFACLKKEKRRICEVHGCNRLAEEGKMTCEEHKEASVCKVCRTRVATEKCPICGLVQKKISKEGKFQFGIEFEIGKAIEGTYDGYWLGKTSIYQNIKEKLYKKNYRLHGDSSTKSGFEMVSPILYEEDIEGIKEVMEIINKQTRATKREGFHIHIGGFVSVNHANNMIEMAFILEDSWKDFIKAHRKNEPHNYAAKTRKYHYKKGAVLTNNQRYQKVNGVTSKGTVEIRALEGTNDTEKLIAWIKLWKAIYEVSKNVKILNKTAIVTKRGTIRNCCSYHMKKDIEKITGEKIGLRTKKCKDGIPRYEKCEHCDVSDWSYEDCYLCKKVRINY